MPGEKRKHTSRTVSEKLLLVDRIVSGKESKAKISRETGVQESTLRGWVKEEANLRSFMQDLDEESGLSRKRARKAQDPSVFYFLFFFLFFFYILLILFAVFLILLTDPRIV